MGLERSRPLPGHVHGFGETPGPATSCPPLWPLPYCPAPFPQNWPLASAKLCTPGALGRGGVPVPSPPLPGRVWHCSWLPLSAGRGGWGGGGAGLGFHGEQGKQRRGWSPLSCSSCCPSPSAVTQLPSPAWVWGAWRPHSLRDNICRERLHDINHTRSPETG